MDNSDYLQASIFTLGCFYRDQGVKFMSMYGSVTDGQVFSRELSSKEMVDITSCRYVLLYNLHCHHWKFQTFFQILPPGGHHQLGQRSMGSEVTMEQIKS